MLDQRSLAEMAQEWEDLKRQGREEEAARVLAARDRLLLEIRNA